MERAVRVRLRADQTWQLVVDRAAQQDWLGPGASLQPIESSRVQLSHEAGAWRSGSVLSVEADENGGVVECRLSPASGWAAEQPATILTIKVEPHPKNGARVTVSEADLTDEHGSPTPFEDAKEFWDTALARLKRLAGRIGERQNTPRQAIIIIHGIGEQEPGATLKSFVAGCIGDETESWSKPDHASGLFELRRITLKAKKFLIRPTTDVYELYWAHVIRDTTLSQVGSWLRHLLFRQNVPAKYVSVWLFSWLAILTTVVLSSAYAAGWRPGWFKYFLSGGIVFLVVTLIWRLLGKSLVLNSVGDAVRYLTPRPANIAHRQSIREAGVDLLHTLHEQGNFDRIVIVGHSLGSVIAYDIITHYWIRVHQQHLHLPRVTSKGASKVERGLDETDASRAQELQHEAWKESRLNGQPWLITDLITVGSPLSTADFLMAKTRAEFDHAKKDRELPACPPVEEIKGGKRRVSFDQAYRDRFGGRDKQFSFYHHAAPFAVTRWTNLFFDSRLLEDPIGGPVGPLFGPWVRDVRLEPPYGREFFLHSHYWRPGGTDAHIEELRKALDLDVGHPLKNELKKHSPLMYLFRSRLPKR